MSDTNLWYAITCHDFCSFEVLPNAKDLKSLKLFELYERDSEKADWKIVALKRSRTCCESVMFLVALEFSLNVFTEISDNCH